MKNLTEFSNHLLSMINGTNNSQNLINEQKINIFKTEIQLKDEKIEDAYQIFLKSQEWGNKLNQEPEKVNEWILESQKIRNKRQQYLGSELSNYVTNTHLEGINSDSSDLQILNAFVRANPNLPQELRVTRQRDRVIYVSSRGQNFGSIGIHSGTPYYAGYVSITFGQQIAPVQPLDTSNQPSSSWTTRLNLSTQNLNTNLGTIPDLNERTIIQAFMFNNQNLPSELSNILRVSNIGNRVATIYVPNGNFRYEGLVRVSYPQQNFYGGRFHDEHKKKREIDTIDKSKDTNQLSSNLTKSINNEQNLPIINNTNFVKSNITSL